MSQMSLRMGFVLMLAYPTQFFAATYYTATDGNDANSGSAAFPWRTIQKAASTLSAGDSVIVRSGSYDEHVSTARAGTNEAGRISFWAEGIVVMRGFSISHPYITVRGFDITGYSDSSYVRVDRDGDFFELLNCTVRDGIQVRRSDMTFSAATSTITSATAGFITDGFVAGQTLYVGAATNGVPINSANSGEHTITAVTDNAITVSSTLVDQGPLFVYLSGSYIFGLSFHNGAERAVVRGNTFRNLGYDAWAIFGNGHLLENNLIEQGNGWDAMHFGGSNHVFHGNLIRNSALLVYQNSPDAMENYSPSPYFNVTFTNNFIEGFIGVLAAQKGQNTMSGLLITHNVFVDVGGFSLTHPNTTLENNTFLRVSKVNSAVHARASHPIFVNASVGATNVSIRNNIFLDCGQPSTSQTVAVVGWYQITGPTNSVIREGNYVSGGVPNHAAKTGWLEANPLLNGGDPGLVNINDPLGPDGLPFTDDDGLRLRSDSKLRGAGVGGLDVGAYAYFPVAPALTITTLSNSLVRLSWPAPAEGFELETATRVTGGWTNALLFPTLENNEFQVTIRSTNGTQFFRLSR